MEEARPVAISVVVPAWNEAERLPASLDAILVFLEAGGRTCEVIVVSDGSDDGTDEGVAARADDRVRLLRHDDRRGKGAAVRTGVLEAKGERVLFTDADLATPIEDLARLQAALDDGADVAIASRRLEASEITQDQGGVRRAMGRFFPRLMQATTGLPYADTQCGFKLFTRKAARRLFGSLQDAGFAFDVEVLCRAREEGLRVDEVPVRWESREGSKVSTVRDPLKMTGALLRLGGRADLPKVAEHQLTVAAGWGAALVVFALLVALLLTRTGDPVRLFSIALLPAVVFLIGRELDGAATGALAALLTVVSGLFLASSVPPTAALFPAVLVHGVLAAFLVGRRKPSWRILMFLLLAVALRAGGIHALVLALVGPFALTVVEGGGAWRRKETGIGLLLFAAVTAAVIATAQDPRAALLHAPCVDAYAPPDSAVLGNAVVLFVLGLLPATLLGIAPGVSISPEGRGRRIALVLWSALPALAMLRTTPVYACSLVGAIGGATIVIAGHVAGSLRRGSLGAVRCLAALLPALAVLGAAAGAVARVDSPAAAAPWIAGGVVATALALLGAFRVRSAAVVLLLLAVVTLLALGAAHAAGWIPLGA